MAVLLPVSIYGRRLAMHTPIVLMNLPTVRTLLSKLSSFTVVLVRLV